MHKYISDYLNDVCRGIPERQQQAIRAELAGHMAEAVDEYARQGMDEDEASARAVEQMGDACEVNKKLLKANSGVKGRTFFIAGLGATLALILLTTIISGGGLVVSGFSLSCCWIIRMAKPRGARDVLKI